MTILWPDSMNIEVDRIVPSPWSAHVATAGGAVQSTRMGAPRWLIETVVSADNTTDAQTFLTGIFLSNQLVSIPADRMKGLLTPSDRRWNAGRLNVIDNLLRLRFQEIDDVLVTNPEKNHFVMIGDATGKRLYQIVDRRREQGGTVEIDCVPKIRPRGLTIEPVRQLNVKMLQDAVSWGNRARSTTGGIHAYGASVQWVEIPNAA